MAIPLKDYFNENGQARFSSLAQREILEENNMPRLDRRLEPLALWLLEIGRYVTYRFPENSLQVLDKIEQVKMTSSSWVVSRFFEESDEKELFPFAVLFTSYGLKGMRSDELHSKHELTVQTAAINLCSSLERLEGSLEKMETASDIDARVDDFVQQFLFFCGSVADIDG